MKLKVIQRTGTSISLNIDIPEDALTLSDYSDKSILVSGSTSIIKSELKAAGGLFGRNFKGEPGWVFSKTKENKVRKIVDTVNQFIKLREIAIDSDEDSEYIEPLRINQNTAGGYHLEGDTVMLENELKSIGCFLKETNGNISVWLFPKSKLNAVEALVSVVNKLR